MNSLEPYQANQDMYHKARNIVSMDRLSEAIEEFTRRPLQDIAAALRSLTYGEMITLATEISSLINLDPHGFAAVLHKWSLTHGTPGPTRGVDTEIADRDPL